MSVFNYEKDSDGIVTITMDQSGPVNCMNAEYREAMVKTVDRLEQEEELCGVIIASAKKVFFAGGDLKELLAVKPGLENEFFDMVEHVKLQFRRLEKLPVPVVAAINGAALGGGFEICLACNYRIALDDKSVQMGLPEVTLGLLPGAGGIVRTVNLIGLEQSAPYLLEGKKLTPRQAMEAGLIHETVQSLDELLPRARDWLLAQKGNAEAALQPWDRKGHKIPGGGANSPRLAQVLMGAPAMTAQKTRGLLPAPAEVLDCAVQAATVDFDTALRVESRAFTHLVQTDVAKNMITTFFFGLNKVNGGGSRPGHVEKSRVNKVGVLGAGMMGQGIAFVSAMAGIEVILKDVSQESADVGKAYSEKLLDKRVQQGRMDEAGKEQVLGLIKATANDNDLDGCDLVIEAVFENMDLKREIIRSSEKYLVANGVWGSNTSTLPITGLAQASSNPANFIGIHFFSPVDKMPLVEIICGELTSDETLARAFDYTQQIKKTPIVVNDSLGFFTSRTFGTYLNEGVRLLHEGMHPVKIDNLGKAIGMPVGPITIYDEVSQQLSLKIIETWDAMGEKDKWGELDIQREVLDLLVNQNNRGGKHHNGGFYDYAEDGSRTVWPPLLDRYYNPSFDIEEQDVKDRLLFRQVIETLKCLETDVLRSVVDGNIGSIMGIGAPVWTGGFIQFVNTYGLEKFMQRCDELTALYGERFRCPAIVNEKARAGDIFS